MYYNHRSDDIDKTTCVFVACYCQAAFLMRDKSVSLMWIIVLLMCHDDLMTAMWTAVVKRKE